MVWLFVLALCAGFVWLFVQAGDLKARLDIAERRLSSLGARFENSLLPAEAPPKPTPSTQATATSAPPAPATAKAPPAPTPTREPEIATSAPVPPRIAAPPAARGPTREQVAAWLSENGLAWIGGGVLALGGLFMVAYAAQRGVFTPAMRIGAATLVGLILVGVSEWLKRLADRDASGNRLAAALAAGAGAATLYAAAWASYWLYGFIGLGVAGGMMGVISLGLLALSLRHGEPLAILAVGGALLAPAITGPQHWDAPALTGYLALVVLVGYAIAGASRWGQAGMTTLAGAVLWATAGYMAAGYVRVAALAVAPVALSILAVEWRRRRAPDDSTTLDNSFALMPTVTIAAAAVLMAGLWIVGLKGVDLGAAILGSGLLLAFAAYAALRRLVPSILQFGVYASAALVSVAFAGARSSAELEIWAGVLAAATAGCGLWAAVGARNDRERLYAGGGALGALIIALAIDGPLTGASRWAPAGLAAIALAACGWLLARRSENPSKSLGLALWFWASGSALLVALRHASDPQALTVVVALAAAGYAVLHVRIGWRGFGSSAIAAGLASLAALLDPDLLRPLFAGQGSAIALAAAAAIAAGVVFAASRMVYDKEQASPTSDALGTAALLIALTGAVLLLRVWGAMGTGRFRLDPFFESSLRTLLSLAAGLLSTLAVRESSHPIGRWRGHVLLLLGLAQALLLQLMVFNPLWASWVPAVSGPPLLDSLALGFLAPALLLGFAASRRVTQDRRLVAAYAAGALVFGLAWAVLETRRLFQGASLHIGIDHIGRAEVAAYALEGLLLARGLFYAAGRRSGSLGEISGPVRHVARAVSWIALAFAVLAYGDLASPWWGPIRRTMQSQGAVALLFALYAAGAATAVALVSAAAKAQAVLVSRASRIVALIVVFALMNLVIRWGFIGLDMRPNHEEASLQTWTFSAAWGLYGFGLLVAGAARRSTDLRWAGLAALLITIAKIFLFDMAHLDGVVRAGSFLAVGALLLAAAVVARRLSGGPGTVALSRPAPPD